MSFIKVLTKFDSLVGEEIELEDDYHIIYEDKFGRRWKLEPLNKADISFPFRTIPLPNLEDKK